MISIQAHDGYLSQLCTNDYRYFDRNLFGSSHYYMGNNCIYDTLLPLVVNEIDLRQATYVIDDETDISNYKEFIKNCIEPLTEDRLAIIKTYCFQNPDIELIDRALKDNDLELMPEVVNNLYQKAIEQCIARENRPQDFPEDWFIRPYIAKEKHMIVVVTNVHDIAQASDQFLTYGLIPVLYKDYAEKFSPEEITYFKTWVSRSQVKRISNVNVSTAFNEMEETQKYKDIVATKRRNYIIRELVNSRLYTAEQTQQRAEQEANNALQSYNRALAQWRTASDLIRKIRDDVDDTMQTFIQALSCKEIIDMHAIDNNGVEITFKDTVKFYDTEEAELALKNKDSSNPMIRLLKDVFIKQRYKLYVAATYRYYIDTNNTTDLCHTGGATYQYQIWNAMFNPHVYYFACLGDYKPQLVKARTDQDIMMFITLALASTRSINFKDGAVVNRWCENLTDMWRNNNNILDAKCLEDIETGELLTIREYMALPDADRVLDVTDTLETEDL